MAQNRIDDIEQAIIDAIKADATLSGYLETVETISDRAFDQNTAQFALRAPAALVFYAGGPLNARTTQLKSYSHDAKFVLIAVAKNLRGPAAAKRGDSASGAEGAYDLVMDLMKLLGGARLTLAGGGDVVAELLSVSPEEISLSKGHSVYSLVVQTRACWDNP